MMNIEELIEKMIAGGIQVKGDFVMHKEVEYEVAHVEPGGIGIQVNHGGATQATAAQCPQQEDSPTPANNAPTTRPAAAEEAPAEEAPVEQRPSPQREQIVSKLLGWAERGDWQAPASVERVQRLIRQLLNLGDTPLSPSDRALSDKLWRLLESGRGSRAQILMQNLIGYFIHIGWLLPGSPRQNECFFGTREGYSNIDKGKPDGELSHGFREVIPLVEKHIGLV